MIDPNEFRSIRNGSMRQQITNMARDVVGVLGRDHLREVVFVPERGDDLGVVHFVCNGMPFVELGQLAKRCTNTSGVFGYGVQSAIRPASTNTTLQIKGEKDVAEAFTTTFSVFIDENLMHGTGLFRAQTESTSTHKRSKGSGVVDADRFDGIRNTAIRSAVAAGVDSVVEALDAHEPTRVTFTPEAGDAEGYVCLVYPGPLFVGEEVAAITNCDGVSSVGVRTAVVPAKMNKDMVLVGKEDLDDVVETTISIFVDETLIQDSAPTHAPRVSVGSKRKR